MQPDTLLHLPEATLQHGPASNRVYLMKLATQDVCAVVTSMEHLAKKHGYTKLFAKIPQSAATQFRADGYHTEARVPGLYNGKEDGLFMVRYLDKKRAEPLDEEQMNAVLKLAKQQKACKTPSLPTGWSLHVLTTEEAPEMGALYCKVFESYPFPITDSKYICKTMQDNVRYFGVRDNDNTLMALASAESDACGQHAEMTDFATHPAARNRGLAQILLAAMEDSLQEHLHTVFTIARAKSPGMNIVFSRAGYCFAGTLLNNTQIKGGLESMHVWYKNLDNKT